MQAPCPSPSVASSAPYQHSLTSHDAQNVSEAVQMKHDKDSIYGYNDTIVDCVRIITTTVVIVFFNKSRTIHVHVATSLEKKPEMIM